MKRYETLSVSQAEADKMIADRLAQVGPVVRRRFVPRNLELRMGYERAAKWLDQKDAERAEEHHDAEIFSKLLGG